MLCDRRSVFPERGTLEVGVLGPDGAVLLATDVVAVGSGTNGQTWSPVEFHDERLRLSTVHNHAVVTSVYCPVPTVTSCDNITSNHFLSFTIRLIIDNHLTIHVTTTTALTDDICGLRTNPVFSNEAGSYVQPTYNVAWKCITLHDSLRLPLDKMLWNTSIFILLFTATFGQFKGVKHVVNRYWKCFIGKIFNVNGDSVV